MRWYSLLCLGLLATANFTGCGGKGGSTAKDVPSTPQGTVEVVMQEFAEGKWGVFWKALPDSYQGDIKHLLEHAPEHLDADVYNKSTDIAGKVVQILTEKQDLILGLPAVKEIVAKGSISNADIKEGLTAAAGLLNDLQKDIKTKEDLAKLDVEKYLGTIGARIKSMEPIIVKHNPAFKEKLEEFKKAKVTAKDVTTDSAKVEIVMGKETETVSLTRVEGKWIPKDLASSWKEEYEKIDHELHEPGEKLSTEAKKKTMDGLTEVEAALDSLLKAKDQAEFETAAKTAMAKFLPVVLGNLPPGVLPIPGN